MLEFGLRAYRDELIATKLNFLLWSWNWISATIVKECHEGHAPQGNDICGELESLTIKH